MPTLTLVVFFFFLLLWLICFADRLAFSMQAVPQVSIEVFVRLLGLRAGLAGGPRRVFPATRPVFCPVSVSPQVLVTFKCQIQKLD